MLADKYKNKIPKADIINNLKNINDNQILIVEPVIPSTLNKAIADIKKAMAGCKYVTMLIIKNN